MSASPPALFIERLGAIEWRRSALPLLRTGRVDEKLIQYFDATTAGLLLASRWAARRGSKISRLSFRASDLRDEKGMFLKYRLNHRDLPLVVRDIAAGDSFRRWIAAHEQDGGLSDFLLKEISQTDHSLAGSLRRALVLLHVSRRFAGTRDAHLLLQRRPWFAQIRAHGERLAVAATATPVPASIKAEALSLIPPSLRDSLRHLRWRGLSGAADMLRGRLDGEAPRESGPRLAAEYYGQLNLSEPALHSDFSFWQQSGMPAERLLLLFRTVADPLDDAKMTEIRSKGMHALALDPAAAQGDVPLFVPSGGAPDSRPPIRVDGIAGDDESFLRTQTIRYRHLVNRWTEIFERYGARVSTGWFKFDGVHRAVAEAMRRVQGVSTIYQRSHESAPCPEAACHADVYFAFSALEAGQAARDGSTAPYRVITGYPGDHRFPLLRSAARKIRDEMERSGARFILAFLDEVCVPDSRWNLGTERMREDYSQLLERVLSDPTLGLILKPKSPSRLMRNLGPLGELLERAISTGRCRVLAEGRLASAHPPAEAALAADVTINGNLWSGTAGIESALAGCRTLILDHDRWDRSPLYELGTGKVICRDWREIWEAIAKLRPGNGPGFEEIGNWAGLLPQLDPFRDGRAAQRIGEYLNSLLDGFSKGLGREDCLRNAAEGYARRWGADKILHGAGKSPMEILA